MNFFNFFELNDSEKYLKQIEECDWDAGRYLAYLIREGLLDELVGGAKLLLLTEGDELISFLTLAKYDDVQPTDLTPWIGWIYTFPARRGRRYAGRLIEYAESLARSAGAHALHISTNHVGLYEKYGYEFLRIESDVEGEPTRVYQKLL